MQEKIKAISYYYLENVKDNYELLINIFETIRLISFKR